MRFFKSLLVVGFCACVCLEACTQAQNCDKCGEFRLPDVPESLVTPEERAAFLSLHYWDHFCFADTSLVDSVELTEQAFVDFLSILPYTDKAAVAVDTMLRRAATGGDVMLRCFVELGDKYLYEPNSPMYNEELYIPVLQSLVTNELLDEGRMGRYRRRLEMALKNRPGDVAADFGFVDRKGQRRTLSSVDAAGGFLLLYFNDPECEDCIRVKEQIVSSPVFSGCIESGRVVLLSVCVEGKTPAWEQASNPAAWLDGYDEGLSLTQNRTYDLKAMPTLYLLDAGKRVILKDASVESIEAYLGSVVE